MTTSKKTSTKTVASKSKKVEPKVRQLKSPVRKSFLGKRSPHPVKLPSAFKIFIASLRILKSEWRKFGAIAAIYLLLSLVLVRSMGDADLPALKEFVTSTLQGKGGDVTVGFTVFGLLLGTTGQATTAAGNAYQSVLLIGITLVIVWALRQAHAGTSFGIKEAFYKAFTPLVPFLGVLLVISVQLIPFLLANFLYGVIFIGGVAMTLPEQIAWAALLLALIAWSLYMLTASLISMYIVTLPDMHPFAALRSARNLVRNRRFTIMRKMLFLPLIILVIAAVIMLPVIIFVAFAAEWIFVVLTALSLLVVHSYLYNLYRELL
jgi:hypothetical protein